METVSLSFGQCGIQLANVFWTRAAAALRAAAGDPGSPTAPLLKSLYRNAEAAGIGAALPRCILVDTEMGPATQALQEADANLIADDAVVAGTDSTGNNWATAFVDYGAKYSEAIEELVQRSAEDCDRLESFSLTFAGAGGTGSGLGSYATRMLAELYPKVPRLASVVANRNVSAVSPYNSLLCLGVLEEHASATLAFSNEEILRSLTARGEAAGAPGRQKTYFEAINALIADFQLRLLATTVDPSFPAARVNAVLNGLMPFAGLNYASPFKSPLGAPASTDTDNLENIYNDLFRPQTRIAPIPAESTMAPMAVAVMGNGDLAHLRHVKRLKLRQKMYGWNRDAVKVNLRHAFADAPGAETTNAIIALSNHTGIAHYLGEVCTNVQTLLNKRAFLHHFLNLVEEQDIASTLHGVLDTAERYAEIDKQIGALHDEIVAAKLANAKDALGIPKSVREAWPINPNAKLLI